MYRVSSRSRSMTTSTNRRSIAAASARVAASLGPKRLLSLLLIIPDCRTHYTASFMLPVIWLSSVNINASLTTGRPCPGLSAYCCIMTSICSRIIVTSGLRVLSQKPVTMPLETTTHIVGAVSGGGNIPNCQGVICLRGFAVHVVFYDLAGLHIGRLSALGFFAYWFPPSRHGESVPQLVGIPLHNGRHLFAGDGGI